MRRQNGSGRSRFRPITPPDRPERGLSRAPSGQVYTRVAGGSPRSHRPGHRFGLKSEASSTESRGEAVSSNIAQNYPYSSEPTEERTRRVEATVAAHKGLKAKIQAESVELEDDDRWWVWKCPTKGCLGLLHAAGYARDVRAVYTVCDTCGMTYLR